VVEREKSRTADYFLDITTEVCPMTFVKTKLMIERMEPGKVLEVRLCGAEPLENVPRSIVEMGHRIVSCTAEVPNGAADASHVLVIEKSR